MRLFYVILIFLLTYLSPTQAQQLDSLPWCPAGATWLYEYINTWGQFYYLKLSYTHDTIINNTNCKALKINHINISAAGPMPIYTWTQTDTSYEYFANINDSIYRWQDGQFVFLYDFNAIVGQEWLVHANPDFSCLDTTISNLDTFTTTAISTQLYDSHYFKTIEGSNRGNWSVGTTIVKNIGSLRAPFVVPINGSCFYIDGDNTPQRLCCYKDDLRGSIAFGFMVPGNCHFVMTPVEKLDSKPISISPNPVVKELFIENFQTDIANYTLYDIQGKILVQKDYTENLISLETYPNGIYFLVFKTEQGEIFSFKIVKI